MTMSRVWDNAYRAESLRREILRLSREMMLLLQELDEINNDSYIE